MKSIILAFAGLVSVAQATYTVKASRINGNLPSLNSQNGDSNFTYNYNPSYIPVYDDSGNIVQDGLLIRAQYKTDQPFGAGPSMMPLSHFTYNATSQEVKFSKINESHIVFESQEIYENYGVEDPRVAYRAFDKTYYMMYSAVEQYTDRVVSQLSLATTQTPWVKDSWVRHGNIFDDSVHWSKSGAIIFRDAEEGPHYLIWGDDHITLATTEDFKTFNNSAGAPFISTRSDHFDSELVESGPPPMKLDDGNYLFFYNSARKGFPSKRPGYELQYNVGWVILDGKDPSKILQRAEEPILSPELDWEVGNEPFLCLVPRVVFLEAAKPLGGNKFLVFYGGADSVVGSAIVEVSSSSEQSFLE